MSCILGVEYFCWVSCCARQSNISGFFHKCNLVICMCKCFGTSKIANALMIVFALLQLFRRYDTAEAIICANTTDQTKQTKVHRSNKHNSPTNQTTQRKSTNPTAQLLGLFGDFCLLGLLVCCVCWFCQVC